MEYSQTTSSGFSGHEYIRWNSKWFSLFPTCSQSSELSKILLFLQTFVLIQYFLKLLHLSYRGVSTARVCYSTAQSKFIFIRYSSLLCIWGFSCGTTDVYVVNIFLVMCVNVELSFQPLRYQHLSTFIAPLIPFGLRCW